MAPGDFLTDRNGIELHRLAQLHDFPAFVKRADIEALRNPERLGPATYADALESRYNCDTRPATWLSALYYFDKRADIHPTAQKRIEQRLEHFAQYWGILPEYEKAAASVDRVKKAERVERDENYAYVHQDPNGETVRRVPIKDAISVKKAAAWLQENRAMLTFSERNRIADRILDKAASFGTALDSATDEFLERQAGRGVCDPRAVVSMIRNRALLTKEAAVQKEITKLADLIANDTPRFCHPDNLVKLAETLDTVDRGLGLVGHYSTGVPAPEDVLFAVTFNKAASFVSERCALVTGTVYDKNMLAKVALDDVRGMFGDDFAAQVRKGVSVDPEKLAELAATLPRPDAEMFDVLMAENGLHPTLAKSASDARIGMSDEELLAWTGEYEVK